MAQRKNTTPWFPGSTKPVRVGVYLRKVSHAWELYSYWDGKKWHVNVPYPQDAALFRGRVSTYQTLPWCGLLEEQV